MSNYDKYVVTSELLTIINNNVRPFYDNYLKDQSEESFVLFLDKICSELRVNLDITDSYDSAKCFEVEKVLSILYSCNDYFDMIDIPFHKVGLDDPLHKSAVIGNVVMENGEKVLKYYIFDPTYVQFDRDIYSLNNGDSYIPPARFLTSDEQLKFKDELINNGFVLLNQENLKLYINSFVDARNNRSDVETMLDKEEAYLAVVKYFSFSYMSKHYIDNNLSSSRE